MVRKALPGLPKREGTIERQNWHKGEVLAESIRIPIPPMIGGTTDEVWETLEPLNP